MSSVTITINSKEQFDNLLKTSRVVVADFYADWCGPCQQAEPLYESLSLTLSRPNAITFSKVNTDTQQEIAKEYKISTLPTFIVFRDGKVLETIQGSNPQKLHAVLKMLVFEVEAIKSGKVGESSSDVEGPWKGAEIPRGYRDLSEEIEMRNLELLNADSDAGPVKALFEKSKPSALDKGKGSSKDWVQSGADDQLLLFVPFQSTVKLHTLQLTSLPSTDDEDAPARPGNIHLYINRPQNMDFSEADDTEPTQAIELTDKDWNAEGTANINLRFVKFQKTSSLIIYVQRGDGEAETVRLDRLKLIGDAGTKREMGQLQKIGDETGE